MHQLQIQELSISVEEQLRASYRDGESRSGDLFIDLYTDDEVLEAVRHLYNVLKTRIGQGAKKCAACVGTCCTSLIHTEIDLTSADVLRLAAHLKQTPKQVADQYLIPMHSTSGDYQFVMVPSERFGHACPFLDEKAGRCKVYEARPLTCRAFSADACEMSRAKKPETGRIRFNELLPTDQLVRKNGGPYTIERK